jgi:hypothetical protein
VPLLTGACAGQPASAPTAPVSLPSEAAAPEPVAPAAPASPEWVSCRTGDAGVSVGGTIRERTTDGASPVSGATVELYDGGTGTSEDALRRGVVNSVVSADDGRYSICLPGPDGAGITAPGGHVFVLRVRKAGYTEASHLFREAYSHWDYGGPTIDLEIERD